MEMFTKNTNNSRIKLGIDMWYEKNLIYVDNYIEDTVFCSNRKIAKFSGFEADGDVSSYELLFYDSQNNSNKYNLSCSNITDRFSISNSNANLTYKIGLISGPELFLINNSSARMTGNAYWLISPYSFGYADANNYYIESDGRATTSVMYYSRGLHLAISLIPGIEYSDGDGSMANPYIIDTD